MSRYSMNASEQAPNSGQMPTDAAEKPSAWLLQ
jgi:hypothetical protein